MLTDTPLRYDVHAHVGTDQGFYLRGWWPHSCTAQDLLQHMDGNGIDRAVCFPFTLPSAFDAIAFADRGKIELLPGRVPFERENVLLLQEVERIDRRQRLLPFAMFDPSRCVAQQLRTLETLVSRIAGLKTQTTTLESPIRSLLGDGRELMAFAERHDLPVLIHTAVYANDPWSQVTDCLDVAAAYPSVRFNLAHSLRFHAAHLRAAARLSNVWVDCAAHLAACSLAHEIPDSPFVASRGERVDADYGKPADVLRAIHQILGDRYMWGSDNPFMSWADDIIRVVFSYRDEMRVLKELPQDIQTDMLTAGPRAWLFGTHGTPLAASHDRVSS
jgi:predicted TIM-barrel fold metal-dependent hydrolase